MISKRWINEGNNNYNVKVWRDIFQLIDCQSLREIDSDHRNYINEHTLNMITTKEFVDALYEF